MTLWFVFALATGPLVATSPQPVPPQPAVSPSPAPSASPTASPRFYDRFVGVDLLLAPQVANALDPAWHEPVTQSIRGALEYHFLNYNYAEVEYRRWIVTHPNGGYRGVPNGEPCNPPGGLPPVAGNPGCVTQIGGASSAYLNPGRFSEQDVMLNSSVIGLGRSIDYLATSILIHSDDYGYPTLSAGFGAGLERLPDFRKNADLFGYIFYYPEVHGKYALSGGSQVELRYRVLAYRLGADFKVPKTPLFLEFGFIGDRYGNKQNAPGDATHSSLTVGVGAHL